MFALNSLIAAFEDVTSADEVESILLDFAGEAGAANIVYMSDETSPAEKNRPIRFVTYSAGWEKRYLDREYIHIDPVARGINRQLPFDWQTVAHAHSTRWLFLEAESYGVGRQGLSLPMRGDAGERTLVSVTSFHSNREWHNLRWRYQALISALAPYLHHLSIRLRDSVSTQRELSLRQRQCLELYGRGNTPKEIAAHFEISDSMVREHLHRARRKLRSMTISSAVIKAAKLRIVDV